MDPPKGCCGCGRTWGTSAFPWGAPGPSLCCAGLLEGCSLSAVIHHCAVTGRGCEQGWVQGMPAAGPDCPMQEPRGVWCRALQGAGGPLLTSTQLWGGFARGQHRDVGHCCVQQCSASPCACTRQSSSNASKHSWGHPSPVIALSGPPVPVGQAGMQGTSASPTQCLHPFRVGLSKGHRCGQPLSCLWGLQPHQVVVGLKQSLGTGVCMSCSAVTVTPGLLGTLWGWGILLLCLSANREWSWGCKGILCCSISALEHLGLLLKQQAKS